MTLNDKPEFERIIDDLADIFPISLTRLDAAKRLYFPHLASLSIESMRQLKIKAIQQLDTFPTVHRLLDLAGFTGNEVCQACRGNARETHVKAITIDFFVECGRSIAHTVEAVYGHCRTSYEDDPTIRLWAKQAIASALGCSTLPYRHQTDAQREQLQQALYGHHPYQDPPPLVA